MSRPPVRILQFLVLTAALLAAAFFSYRQGWWRFNYPDPAGIGAQGLDVSHHQGEIRWAEIPKSQFGFVYIKASEGGDFRDKQFLKNWEEARANGFQAGAYHFFTLCRAGKDQAQNFTGTVPRAQGALPPAIDLEFTGNCGDRPEKEKFLKELRDFSAVVENHYRARPVLYTTYSFYWRYLEGSEFAAYPLWIRDVFGRPDTRQEWALWQYADNARVPGIDGPVDLNAMRKN